ncbi:hypothetical protein [Caballeronia sordidicola]|uniref:hypothetical protein n=1 Tax=Caballeronia sordidicola TaxID=196367 RepID=UPI00094C8599|nr:hypothetical protein [Caballeronia sordidicola]
MGADDSTLDLDFLRGEILRKTGQKVGLDDPLMAAIVLIDHCVRANLIAAKDAAEACRRLVDQSGAASVGSAPNAALVQHIQALRDEVTAALASAPKNSKQQPGKQDSEIVSLSREIQILVGMIDSVPTKDDFTALRTELWTRLGKLSADKETQPQSISNEKKTIESTLDYLDKKFGKVDASLKGWSETLSANLPRAISLEIRASEWRIAGKAALIFAVLYVSKIVVSHIFKIPL